MLAIWLVSFCCAVSVWRPAWPRRNVINPRLRQYNAPLPPSPGVETSVEVGDWPSSIDVLLDGCRSAAQVSGIAAVDSLDVVASR
jgi:hypothetical protein